MGPIWPAIKSARAQLALLWEYLRACCTGAGDFEDAKTGRRRRSEKAGKKITEMKGGDP